MADASLINKLNKLKDDGFFDNLVIKRGVEKEFFRVNESGYISKKPHPESLGSALTNRYITTDFAEAQVELVTPVFENVNELYNFLYSLHVFVAQNIDKSEMLWPFSMPPRIKKESDINLGYYHQSNIGLLKHVYRRGLKVRYGPTMQCVSGMHYNFSIKPSSLFIFNGSNDQKDIDSAYLGLIRNFKRLFWFVLSEFGQTNVVDKSFIKNRKHILKKLNEEDMYLKDATSLRMSEIGYQSKAQKDLDIKYNSLNGFLEKIKHAITVPYSEFEEKELKDSEGNYHQISNGIIQIENEYYDSIRPKRSSANNMRPYDLLKNFGIEYVEIRGIDISPYDLTGMSVNQMHFLDLVLLYCLIKPSPEILANEKIEIDSNDYKAIYSGRNENIEMSINGVVTDIRSAKDKIIKDLKLLAGYLKENDLIQESIETVLHCKKGIISKNSFHNTGLEKAKSNIEILRSDSTKDIDSIKKEAELSLVELSKIQKNSKEEMDEYVKSYNLNL
mgnify:CR=1 FL=1